MGRRTPWDTLLRIRRIEEDRAKAALATARREAVAAEEALTERAGEYTRIAAGLDAGRALDLQSFRRGRASGTAAAAALVTARLDVREAGVVVDDSVHTLTGARMRTQGLEKLIDRAKAAATAEILAADQRTAEESRARMSTRGRA